ncbi:histone deacetylase [Shewanella sp. OPT22]|nr:histone deacetylase [Shewanella sp. OPT22]
MIPYVYHASYSELALPPTHRFPTTKYQDLYEYLLESKFAKADQFHFPDPISSEELFAIHDPNYVKELINGTLDSKMMRRIGFPWSKGLIRRTLHSIAGTRLTASLALEHGCALHLSGGYHHSHYDFGSGFCLFNDLIFAATEMQKKHGLETVLIFDCDVHQGDGTASLGQNHEGIVTCSLHCGKNFPARKMHSDYDIELEKEMPNLPYLETVSQTFEYLIRLHQPDLIIYDAGVDVHKDDDLGYLNICDDGIYQRDTNIFSIAKQNDIPVAAVIGGGYSRNRPELVNRHYQLFKAAHHVFN